MCEGKITRRTCINNIIKESILDFFIVCDQILPLVSKMKIDEVGQYALTKYRKGTIVKADHNMLKLEINLTFHDEKKHERTEVFNLRNKMCQDDFKEKTSNTDQFTKCFESEETIDIQFKKWHRRLLKALHTSFRKIRIQDRGEKKKSKMDVIMDKKKVILKKGNLNYKDIQEINKLDEELTVECSDKEFEKVTKICGTFETNSGVTNVTNIWRQFKKAYPKITKPLPTGVKNVEGKIITNPEEKKKVILEHFRHRMRKRPSKDEVKNILISSDLLFDKRVTVAKSVKSPPFEMAELESTLKSLKLGKSRDPENLVRDIFKEGVIGSNLKMSLLLMVNKIKEETTVPECMQRANITMLHKKKNRLDLDNWRGIFVTSVLRIILMKMLHDRAYDTVAQSMTDSQIGAQRKKSVRNHMFVLNSIMSDVLSSKKKTSIDLNIMDYKQMFDSEEAPICLNALYEAGVKDDIFALICQTNKSATFAIRTPNGITQTTSIYNKIMQGDVLSPLVSSNMVDQHIGKKALETGQFYLYKNKVKIPPLAMVDDTLGISECGVKTASMNQFLNTL